MCWRCGSPITESEPIGRSLRCAVCGKDLRVCRNCRFFTTNGAGCRETAAERIPDTEKANFCDWFALNPAFRAFPSAADTSAESARSAFDALFG